MMDYKKIVEELRNDDLICPECERKAECNGEPGCLVRHDAADAIESMTAENARLRAELDAAMADLALAVNKCSFCISVGCWKRNGISECKFKWRGGKGENDGKENP